MNTVYTCVARQPSLANVVWNMEHSDWSSQPYLFRQLLAKPYMHQHLPSQASKGTDDINSHKASIRWSPFLRFPHEACCLRWQVDGQIHRNLLTSKTKTRQTKGKRSNRFVSTEPEKRWYFNQAHSWDQTSTWTKGQLHKSQAVAIGRH